MTRNIFDGMKVPEEKDDKITEYSPPEEEFDLALVIKPVEYYEKRFQRFLDEKIRSLEDEEIAEYREEFGHLVDILNGMSGGDRDLSYELDDLLINYWEYLKRHQKCLEFERDLSGFDEKGDTTGDANLREIYKQTHEAITEYGKDLLYFVQRTYDDTKSFFADLRRHYTTAIHQYYLQKVKKDKK